MSEGPITTIVTFAMPPDSMDEFVGFWNGFPEFMLRQLGIIGGVFHQAMDADAPYQFVNVVRWQNAQQISDALTAITAEYIHHGQPIPEVFGRLKVTMTQSNFTEVLRYPQEQPAH